MYVCMCVCVCVYAQLTTVTNRAEQRLLTTPSPPLHYYNQRYHHHQYTDQVNQGRAAINCLVRAIGTHNWHHLQMLVAMSNESMAIEATHRPIIIERFQCSNNSFICCCRLYCLHNSVGQR